jgi:transcriptional regulator with XRE-family HTH domain
MAHRTVRVYGEASCNLAKGKVSMTTDLGPIASRRRLRVALRTAREKAKLTQDTVAEEMDWSLSKLIRIETGRVSISTNDVKALLRLYGVTDAQETAELVGLARVARQKPWWQEYRESIPPLYAQFIGLEAEASALRWYHSSVVPGLFQTREYAKTLVSKRPPGQIRPEEIDTLVDVRMRRAHEVLSTDPPRVDLVLDEAVLRRAIGGPDVHRAQLAHLADLVAGSKGATQGSTSETHGSTIRLHIVPFSAGAMTALGSFVILEFPDPADADVVYLESAIEDMIIIDRPDDTRPYHDEFEELRKLALPVEEAVPFIRKVAAEIR